MAAPLARILGKAEYNELMDFNEKSEMHRLLPDVIKFLLNEIDKSELAEKVQAIREKFGKI